MSINVVRRSYMSAPRGWRRAEWEKVDWLRKRVHNPRKANAEVYLKVELYANWQQCKDCIIMSCPCLVLGLPIRHHYSFSQKAVVGQVGFVPRFVRLWGGELKSIVS